MASQIFLKWLWAGHRHNRPLLTTPVRCGQKCIRLEPLNYWIFFLHTRFSLKLIFKLRRCDNKSKSLIFCSFQYFSSIHFCIHHCFETCLSTHSPCRCCSDRTFQTRQPVAEDFHRARGPASVPGPRGRSSDHTALLPAGGNWTSERTLLLLLRRTRSMRPGKRRRHGPETVESQWDALWTLLKWNDHKGL